jgi:ATP-dependent Clp protease ATP-binding subunit ClpA
MISRDLKISLEATAHEARENRREYLTVEHILLAVLHDEVGTGIITSCGGDIARIRSRAEAFIDENVGRLPEGSAAAAEPTIGFQRVIHRAVSHIFASGKNEADAGDLLASVFLEKDAHAAYLLESEGVTRLAVLEYISHGRPSLPPDGGTGTGEE